LKLDQIQKKIKQTINLRLVFLVLFLKIKKERTRLPAWQEKSFPVGGVCFAPATKS